jgi:hypothetical protein
MCEFRLKIDALSTHRRGDKRAALNFVKRKKRVDQEIADKDIQYQKLLSMLEQLVMVSLLFSTLASASNSDLVCSEQADEGNYRSLSRGIQRLQGNIGSPGIDSREHR